MSLESKNSSGLQRVFTPSDLTEAGWNNCTLQREQKLGRRKGGRKQGALTGSSEAVLQNLAGFIGTLCPA